jgi:tetratricopeptide (TPR) repeat protein
VKRSQFLLSCLRVSLGALLALVLAGSTPSEATNTSRKTKLEVTLHGGKTLRGRLEWKKDHLRVRGGRKKKIPYRDISAIRAPALETEKELEAGFEARKSQRPPGDAKAWLRLARWAREHGLYDHAAAACEEALKLEPDNVQARHGAGQVEDPDKGWISVTAALAARRAKLKPGDHDGQIELARFARKHGAETYAFDICVQVLLQDAFHEGALRVIRPETDRYRQRTKLRLPIAGRWEISEDRTRHHQKKGYAVYAVDLTKVDENRKHYRNRGKKLEDHFAWDAPFYAVADGTVVEVREGFPDNPIGKIGDKAEKHNGVAIDHGEGEMSWYVHAKKGSITVKLGQRVKRGQLLGTVGNSGGSAIPHLHFTLVSFRGISVPWRCESFEVIAPDGTPVRALNTWPREGWVIRGAEPKPIKADPPADEEDDDEEDDDEEDEDEDEDEEDGDEEDGDE